MNCLNDSVHDPLTGRGDPGKAATPSDWVLIVIPLPELLYLGPQFLDLAPVLMGIEVRCAMAVIQEYGLYGLILAIGEQVNLSLQGF